MVPNGIPKGRRTTRDRRTAATLVVAIVTTATFFAASAQEPRWPWDPLVAACMENGGTRGDCIASLPIDVRAELESSEAFNGAIRRSQTAARTALGQSATTFGQTQAQLRHEAPIVLKPSQLRIMAPETVNEPFLLQLFEIDVHESGEVVRHMQAASEVHESAARGDSIEIARPLGDAFYLRAKDLRDWVYLRLVLTESLLYRDYKPTSFEFQSDGKMTLDGYVQNHKIFQTHVTSGFAPISHSQPFSIRIVREQDANFQSARDYSRNLAFVEGMPNSYSQPLALDVPLGWHYEIGGIYFSDSGGERYIFRRYVADSGTSNIYAIGSTAITIACLSERSFRIDDVSYVGDEAPSRIAHPARGLRHRGRKIRGPPLEPIRT